MLRFYGQASVGAGDTGRSRFSLDRYLIAQSFSNEALHKKSAFPAVACLPAASASGGRLRLAVLGTYGVPSLRYILSRAIAARCEDFPSFGEAIMFLIVNQVKGKVFFQKQSRYNGSLLTKKARWSRAEGVRYAYDVIRLYQ